MVKEKVNWARHNHERLENEGHGLRRPDERTEIAIRKWYLRHYDTRKYTKSTMGVPGRWENDIHVLFLMVKDWSASGMHNSEVKRFLGAG